MFGWIGIIIGVLLLLFAAFMIFLFPASQEHQPDPYGWNGVLFGFIAGIVGIVLIFL
jgi:NhaP-type Na+/H+ or K+/H+ antiporter